jgi:hypothetical protein
MRIKWALFVALCATLATGCSSSEEPGRPSGDGITSAPSNLPITDLPTMCEGFGKQPEAGQVTFVKGELIFGVSADGEGVHCIAGVPGINPIAWGPQGDYVIDVGFTASEVISAEGRDFISGPGESPRFQGISRPEGTHTLSLGRDGSSIAKVPVDGEKLEDISFLRRHDEATYHPAGTQIAVLGETKDDVYGAWLVTNEGEDPTLVVPSVDEDEYYGLAFSAAGDVLYYVEDQHFTFELRALDLSTLREGVALPKSELLAKKREPLIAVVSPFTDGLLAYRVGSCEKRFTTFIRQGSSTIRVGAGLGETQPIGWLPDDRLVLASTKDLCDPARALDLHVVDGERVTLLVEDVSQAAIRAVVPEGHEPVGGPVGSTSD